MLAHSFANKFRNIIAGWFLGLHVCPWCWSSQFNSWQVEKFTHFVDSDTFAQLMLNSCRAVSEFERVTLHFCQASERVESKH